MFKRILPWRLKHWARRTLRPAPKPSKEERRRAARERRIAERVPRWSRSERPGAKGPVRVGFVGAGDFARHHLEVLASYDAVEVAALLTTGGPRAAELGIERRFTDPDEFTAQPDLDCFVVVVPPRAVVDVASRCLATGRPVLLEKPPGVTSDETRQLIRAADAAGTWGMVALNRRFTSVVEHGLAALAELGAIRGATLEIPQRFTEDRQSGRLSPFDYEHFYVRNSIHGVDLLRYVMGEARSVHSLAWTNTEFSHRAASYAAILDYGRGVIATQLDLWDSYGPESRLKVVAEQGWVEWEPPRTGWLVDRKGRYPIPLDPVDERFRPGLWAQDLHFVEAVRAGRRPTAPAATLEDALGTMLLMEQILGSSLGA
jgi:myo-inositol 2-dehydrogenase/D-chiro-inositol 1-dehydrogenase